MKLLIHDLNAKEWDLVRGEYEGWTVVSDDGTIHPCVGCFCCWHKDPGHCIIRDNYNNMGYLIHHAESVTVISRFTYGGFSGFVKNVFDRSLGYVLPQFEVIGGETHHKKRYDEDKEFTFIFRGQNLSGEEKESARRYVQAVCTNIRGHVKEVIFREDEVISPENEMDIREDEMGIREDEMNIRGNEVGSQKNDTASEHFESPACETAPECEPSEPPITQRAPKTILLNGSMRTIDGNSARMGRRLAGLINGKTDNYNLRDYLEDLPALVRRLDQADAVVLCTPLYVDGLPAQVIRLMETFEALRCGKGLKIYLLANMGLFESQQLVNLFAAVRQWCGKTGCSYCGGLGVSAGEMLGLMIEKMPFGSSFTKKAAEGMTKLAEAITRRESTEDIFAEPYRFPRFLYIRIANGGWVRQAKRNGINPKDLYRRL